MTIQSEYLCCREYGTLVGEPVVLIATGIGPVATAICLAEVSTAVDADMRHAAAQHMALH